MLLPENLIPDGTGNPLNKCEEFLACKCPKCGADARRETDTMDTFVDSSWYYMRYCSPDSDKAMVDERNDYWSPMDQYIGGIEHAVLHLLYARFWTKVMRDLGLVKFDEPFKRLFTQGMLTAECFYREQPDGSKRWYYPYEINIEYDEKGRPCRVTAKDDGLPVVSGGIEKMSKSKNNVVEPRDIIKQFGADAVRYWAAAARLGLDATYDEGQMKIGRRLAIKLLNATKFALAIGREDENHHVGAPATASWNPADVTEPLDRAAMAKMALVVREATESLNNYEHSKALEVIENYFWQFCDDYIELVKNRAYGTADATGHVPSEKAVKSARTALGLGLDAFARLLAPYLPYATEEVWSWMHEGEGSVHHAAWPKAETYDAAAAAVSPELLTHAGEALAALRGIKSKAKVSMKTPILSVQLGVSDEARKSIESALGDIAEAGRVVGRISFMGAAAALKAVKETAEAAKEAVKEAKADAEAAIDVIVADSELGEPPAKKPKN